MNKCISIFALTLLIALRAHSETITFDDIVPSEPFPIGSGLPYEHSGYQITDGTPGGLYAFVPPNGTSQSGVPSAIFGPTSDSVFLAISDIPGTYVSLSRTDGQLFTLNGLDVGISPVATSGYITLSGQRGDSSSFSYQFTISDGLWHTLSLTNNSDLSNVRSVSIAGFGGLGVGIAIDNIIVSQVPTPPAVWLFGSGLIGLTGIARKRKTI